MIGTLIKKYDLRLARSPVIDSLSKYHWPKPEHIECVGKFEEPTLGAASTQTVP